MSTISACLVVRNEEAVIERCLRSLAGAVDEIVLVHDGPCSDRTLEIAERFGARITVADCAGVSGPHVPLAFTLATGEWLLRIDADEYLSDELRAALPGLVARDDVDGWAVTWPIWKHSEGRYVTRNGPSKIRLTRRAASVRLGLPHAYTHVRGRVERIPLVLEHRPLYDNFALRTVLTKWRSWAQAHAHIYLRDWRDIQKFGYGAGGDWPRRRKLGTVLSPLLVPAYFVAEFATALWTIRRMRPVWQVLKVAFLWAVYVAMVRVYVAKYRYFSRR
jgi:glycosyltransferase involved in cell wall biosynthesis